MNLPKKTLLKIFIFIFFTYCYNLVLSFYLYIKKTSKIHIKTIKLKLYDEVLDFLFLTNRKFSDVPLNIHFLSVQVSSVLEIFF